MTYYHVAVRHRSGETQAEFMFDLDCEEVESRFLKPHAKGQAIVVNGRSISHRRCPSNSDLQDRAKTSGHLANCKGGNRPSDRS